MNAIQRFLIALGIFALLVLLAVGIGMCTAGVAHAASMTFTLTTPCTSGTVSRKGNDVIIRCGGVQWLYITDATHSCPKLAVTRDAQGNLTVRCP
jgi:hypothetical protein